MAPGGRDTVGIFLRGETPVAARMRAPGFRASESRFPVEGFPRIADDIRNSEVKVFLTDLETASFTRSFASQS